jgi:hypothetical protein
MAKVIRISWVFWLCLVGASLSLAQTRPSTTIPKTLSARQIVERIMPSVVLVVTQDKQGQTIAQGSGFVYKSGLVATNLHVFSRASSAFVRVVGGSVNYKVIEVVGIDIRHDLCVVRIEDKTIAPLVLDNSSRSSIGDEVFAFGSPKGLEGTVSKGIVSSLRSDFGLLQIDAAISPGSSGGPVVNDRAEVIGITVSSLIGGQNLNFAIPTSFLVKVKEQFIGLVAGAGTVSVSDRENERLMGPVKSYITTFSPFEYDEKLDKYVEQASRAMTGKEVFDEFGNLAEEWDYDNEKLAWKYFYYYDENGFMTSFIWEPASGVDGKRETYTLTAAESVTRKMKRINLIGIFEDSQGKWTYDYLGNNTETVSKSIGTRSLTTYNKNGLETDSKYYVDGKLLQGHRYIYEFDASGNWIKCFVSRYDSKFPSLGYIPSGVRYREITY